LSSIPLGQYVKYNENDAPYYDYEEMGNAGRFLVRMLNRIIDINDYPVEETRRSNFKHRPLGIGV
jgi:ribonucleoside-diphosphate reductase alpha chain